MKKRLKLPDVTLLSATSSEVDEAQISMRISLHNIEFGAAKLLSPSKPKKQYPDIEYVPIAPMNSVDDYNCMIFQDLHKYFNTSHCLIVQADSFVVNSRLWKNEFLEYDYIGGPWPNKIEINPNLILHLEKNPVGNGGFSLRSKKLVEATSKINFKRIDLVMFLVLLWIIPTIGLFVSSFRDKDQLAITGWWTAFSTTEKNEFRRTGTLEEQFERNGKNIISGKHVHWK